MNRTARRPIAVAVALLLLIVSSAGTMSAATGPYLVRDIRADGPSNPMWLTAVGNTLFFTARGPRGRELYKSDGTRAGTVRIKDIRPGTRGSMPTDLVNVGGTLFFRANDGVHGVELWKSNGTAAGTMMVEDLTPGPTGSEVGNLTNVGGMLLFHLARTNRELWRSDGTPAGTNVIEQISPNANHNPATSLLVSGGTWFFQISTDGVSVDVWQTDGTESGTEVVDFLLSAFWLIKVGSKYYFSHYDQATGIELWRSDGTADGIELVKDINDTTDGFCIGNSDTCHSDPTRPVMLNGVMHFGAYDPQIIQGLWRSDGTAGGTYGLGPVQDPFDFTRLGNRLLFSAADEDNDYELWRTNGTPQGTVRVKAIAPPGFGSGPNELTRVGTRVYFSADGNGDPLFNSNRELYRTDGTAARTKLVAEINQSAGSNPQDLINVGGTLYFTANDGTHGRELWRYVP